MQNIHLIIRNSILIGLIFFIPLYPVLFQEWVTSNYIITIKYASTDRSIKKWILDNRKAVIGATAVACGMLAPYICYSVLAFIKGSQGKSINESVVEDYRNEKEITRSTATIEDSVEDAKNCVDQKEKQVARKSMNPFTINGHNISDVVKPGEALVYENVDGNNLAFNIENNTLVMGSARIDNVQEVYNRFVEFCHEKHGTMKIKRLQLSDGTQFLNNQYISSQDEMIINVEKTFCISETVLKAKKVNLIADKIDCRQCFIDSDEFVIQTCSGSSMYKMIKFTRNKNSKNPMVLIASVNFARPSFGGVLVVLGAQSVTIDFSTQAFK